MDFMKFENILFQIRTRKKDKDAYDQMRKEK